MVGIGVLVLVYTDDNGKKRSRRSKRKGYMKLIVLATINANLQLDIGNMVLGSFSKLFSADSAIAISFTSIRMRFREIRRIILPAKERFPVEHREFRKWI